MSDPTHDRSKHDAEIQHLKQLLDRRADEIASLQRRLAETDQVLAGILSSKSWRMTAAARQLAFVMRDPRRHAFIQRMDPRLKYLLRTTLNLPRRLRRRRDPLATALPSTRPPTIGAPIAVDASRYQEPPRRSQATDAWAATVLEAAAAFAQAHGRAPFVLDWTAARELAEQCPELSVFAPPTVAEILPYADHTIDIVAIATESAPCIDEACRVADSAVIHLTTRQGTASSVHWLREPAVQLLPSASIIIPVFNQWTHTAACLDALRRTLPTSWRGEIVIVDDASTDETPHRLQELAAHLPSLQVLRNESNSGFLDSANRGAAAAGGEILVFLNNDTIPLPGWLPPLLQTFSQFDRVGAVGGKLLFPDGRLQEAGGIIFRDGSAAHFGRNEKDPNGLLFNYVREVDYCSGALLATRRSTFDALGGFDPAYRPGYYEDTDYCFRLRENGLRVYYQPQSTIIHLEGGTAGTNPAAGMKRAQITNGRYFLTRWNHRLMSYGAPAQRLEPDAWYALARRVGEP